MKYLSLLLLLTSLNMENSQTISGPTGASNRHVLDASGTGCRRLSPPDPADDPGGISCSISKSCSRTGSLHATAVDIGPSYPRVEVEEASFDHEEEVYDGSQPVLDPRLASGLKLNNVAYNPSLYRRGNEGQTASQELYNSEKYASLAEAQVDDEVSEASSEASKSHRQLAHHEAVTSVGDERGIRAVPSGDYATSDILRTRRSSAVSLKFIFGSCSLY